MKGTDLGFALFMGVCTAGLTFLAYMLGHDDGWFDGNEEKLKDISKALETATADIKKNI